MHGWRSGSSTGPAAGRRPRGAAAGPWPSPCSTPGRSTRPGPTAWRTRSSSATCSTASPPSTRPAPSAPPWPPPGPATRPCAAGSSARPDARWSDGSPVRSTDFTYAWQRLADPKAEPAPSPARTLLSGVTGYRAFAAGRARSIAGLETPDPATLVVRLDRPFADLPALVAAIPLSPLPAALVRPDPAAYLTHPVGNGPFRLAAPARPGPLPDPGPQPRLPGSPALLDKVSVHVVPDEQTAWLELQNGRVAFAPVPRDQLPAARTVHGLSPDGRTTPASSGPTLTTWQLTFNLKSNLGRNPTWRQAVSLAIDRDQLAAALAGSAATPWFPRPPLAVGRACRGGRTRPARRAPRPAKARSLFAKAKGSRPGHHGHPAGADARRVAALIAGDLPPPGST